MFASLRVTKLIGVFGFVAMFGMTGSAYAIGSSHNLASGNEEVCIYCHTPHNGDTTKAPLWSRLDTAGGYTAYTSPTIDMTISSPQGVSLACLSCHDGSLAFNALTNVGNFADAVNVGTMPAGDRNFGLVLSNQHPISITYDNDGTGFSDTAFADATLGKVGALPLYGVDSDQVECGSCHDPHLDEAVDASLLRIPNISSNLCLTCHVK